MSILSEIGTKVGTELKTLNNKIDNISVSGSSGTSSFKNKIINGGFDIWQRGTSFDGSITEYTADRWELIGNNNNILSKVLISETQTNGVHILSTVDDNFVFGTKLEDLSLFNNKTLTLSCKAKSNTGTNLRLYIYYYDTSDTLISSESIGTKIAIDSTLTNYEFTWTVPDLSTSSIKSNTSYMYVRLDNASIQDVDMTITQVQLEEGSEATSFEQRPLTIEQLLCYRYYQIEPYKPESSKINSVHGHAKSNTIYEWIIISLATTMRDIPTVSLISGYGNNTIPDGKVRYITATTSSSGIDRAPYNTQSTEKYILIKTYDEANDITWYGIQAGYIVDAEL